MGRARKLTARACVTSSSVFFLQSTCCHLLFRVLKWLLHAFSPRFLVRFSGRGREECIYSLLTYWHLVTILEGKFCWIRILSRELSVNILTILFHCLLASVVLMKSAIDTKEWILYKLHAQLHDTCKTWCSRRGKTTVTVSKSVFTLGWGRYWLQRNKRGLSGIQNYFIPELWR